MQLHSIQPNTKKHGGVRIGRGGKRGKTSGKGHKGQKARAGNSMRPEMRDFIKRFPKLRGHGKNRARTVNAERVLPVIINVSALNSFAEGTDVSPKMLVAEGIVSARAGRAPHVKILGAGELSKKLSVSNCIVSASAKEKIEKAGGSVL